ncbi:MAG: Wzz/FepE/Etk N-terminal domain-containing protein [Bacteroidales bacterium]|nr:Wzz/FepE/Etk N-terminal domain-containing protein [Bacteroidales bacterium]
MEKARQAAYNFSSVDLLIYIWKKKFILMGVGIIAAIASVVVSLLITPMFQSSVIMFPASGTSISKDLLSQNYSGRQNVHGFGEEQQAEQLLQVLNSEPIRTRIIQKYNLMEHYEISASEKYPLTRLYEKYKSNINFRLTEYMSVEISVRDKDPGFAANIANDISDLVDTVYNSMIKERTWEAYRLVEKEYLEAARNLDVLKDSMDMLSARVSENVKTSGDPANNLVRTISENGALYITMMNMLRYETSLVSDLNFKYKEARLEAEQNLPHKFVVEEAYPSEKKAYPNKSLIVLVSTFASLLFALIVLIIIDNVRARVAIQEEK